MIMGPKRLPLEKNKKQNRKRSTGGVGVGNTVSDTKLKSGLRTASAYASAEPVHEAFVRAFGVPTNMYRYLALRHRERPLILHRSLSYMQLRDRERSHQKGRRPLEQLVSSLVDRAKSKATDNVNLGSYMCCDLPFNASLSLTFVGIFDSAKEKEWETVEAELDVYVIHHCYDRRKQKSSRVIKKLTSEKTLACNPPAGGILSDNFQSVTSSSGDGNKAVTLLYKELIENTRLSRTEYSQLVLRLRAKERRLYSKVYDSPPNSSKRSKRDDRFEVHYRASLPLLQQRGHLELLDGEYEARLEVDPDDSSTEAEQLHERDVRARRNSEWLSLAVPQTAPEMVEFESWPYIRFRAQWQGSRQSCQRHKLQPPEENISDDSEVLDEKDGVTERLENGKTQSECDDSGTQVEVMDESSTEEKKEQPNSATKESSPSLTVTYRFVHEGQLRQWSETRDFVCPWCERNCQYPKSLVAHLAACHPRFAFRSHHAPARNHLSLEVTLSRDFDASNDSIGFRRQAAHRSARISRGASGVSLNSPPERRLPFTHLIHWKGLQQTDSQPTSASGRPLRVGHQRQYHHTWSCLPVFPSEFEEDSEEEESTSWLYQYYQRNIAEFTDVNAGEKRLMTLWNAHLLRHKFLGDGQVGMAAETFVREQAVRLSNEGLRGNLILHLANLADYGVLRPETIERCVALFDHQQQEVTDDVAVRRDDKVESTSSVLNGTSV